MTATILVVDDEPDLEALVLQKFRRQIRDGAVTFVFAHDGIEALQSIEDHPHVDMVVSDINMPRMDGLSLLAEAAGGRGQEVDHHRLGLWRHEQHPHRDEPRRVRFPDQADRFRRSRNDHRQDHPPCRDDARGAPPPGRGRARARVAVAVFLAADRQPACLPTATADGMEVHRREVATIFTDITSFTSLVETTAPEVLGELLNEYMGGMTDVVFAHEGTVAKIIGDGIQILFNAPGDQPDYATRAVACAHDLDAWAEEFRERWKAKGVNFGATRIGVHAGPALVGNFGGSRFFDYTAYGDTINTAARLEAANKFLGTRICVSATVADGAENFRGRPVGDLVLRGRSEPLRAYEPLPAATFEGPATTQYSEAFAKLEAGDAAAMPAFAALVGLHADDALAGFHLRRLLNGAKGVRMQLE